MIRFTDGPAAGVCLILRRAPLYLRVVRDAAGKWDALDQIADVAGEGDRLVVAYRRVGPAGVCMIDWTEKRRRVGGRFASAVYAVAAEQPADDEARDTARWRAWCYAQRDRDTTTPRTSP